MISFGRITIKVLICLWWTTTTTLLLLSSSSSSSTQCSAAFVAADEAAADTAEGESIATDAAATTETAATTNTDVAKKEHGLRKTWTLFHSVDSTGQANDTSFTPRAKVTLEVHINEVNKNAKATPPVLTIENHNDCLPQESVHRMMETEWYQLKLVEDDDNGSSNSNGVVPPPVLATVPACRMRLANFR